MKNMDAVLEKLMLNRAALMMKRFDKELKDVLHSDIQKLKPKDFNIFSSADQRLTA